MKIVAHSIIPTSLALLLVACQASTLAPPSASVSPVAGIQASATPLAPTVARIAGARPPAAVATPGPSATPLSSPATTRPTAAPSRTPTCYPWAVPPPFATPKGPVTCGPVPEDLAGVVEALPVILSRYPGDLGALYAVLAEWGSLDTSEPLRMVDLDDDGVPEVLLQLTAPRCASIFPRPRGLAVLRESESGYTVTGSFVSERNAFSSSVPLVGDLTGDSRTEFIIDMMMGGVHSFPTQIHVFDLRQGELLNLTPEPLEMVNATESFEDLDDDGRIEVILRGGVYGSVGAGPPQSRTETYAWDGQGFRLTSTVYDASPYRVHAIFDGDRALRRGDLPAAIASYTSAVADPDLLPWAADPAAERLSLEAFAYYRLVTVHALLGNSDEAERDMDALRSHYAEHPFHALAEAFWEVWHAGGSVAAACAAARANAEAHPDTLAWFSDSSLGYGYGNPHYTLDDICFLD